MISTVPMLMTLQTTLRPTLRPPASTDATSQGRRCRPDAYSLTYKAEAAETGGRLVCVEISVPPGVGIPPHRHRNEDEAFYVLAGCVIIEGDDCGVGGVSLEAGGFFYGPRGRVHGFRCGGTDAARLLVLVTPGTGTGAMFAELAELGPRMGERMDPAQVAAVCGRYGVTFVRP
ncbi:cupin domain-containing protein [Belnapia sp. T6]|uniref:Cupin domain-containing protein n=1 Tax=Belnapia mucosa TaxID=2804532 RepID=A0ABS1VC70_9PROT|nr:cupin domain-containing protein [Belnapia mucosa]MBL6459272.1 cupin domain-containing protein [Belnapia mucosa]